MFLVNGKLYLIIKDQLFYTKMERFEKKKNMFPDRNKTEIIK